MPWQPNTILRPEQAFKTATDAVKVMTDAGAGYLKALGNHGSPHYLAADLVGTRLAAWLDLPTFELALIEVTTEDEIKFYSGGHAEPGPAFITREQSGMTWGGTADELNSLINPADIVKLVVFDTWTRNCDRYPPDLTARKPNRNNVFLSNEGLADGEWRLIAMDHTHCFHCGRDLNAALGHIDLTKDERMFGLFPEFKPFIQAYRNELDVCLAHLGTFTKAYAENLVDEIPPQWQVEPSGKTALVTLLTSRAQFVTANFISWINREME